MRKRAFSFQVHMDPGEVMPSARIDDLKAMLGASGASIQEESSGSDHGNYINISVVANHPGRFWQGCQKLLQSSPSIERSLIVVCEGENGWEDYLLLQHFDKNESVDPWKD